MNIVGIIVGIEKQLHYFKDISDHFKMKWQFVRFVFLLAVLTLDITIILLIINQSAGRDRENCMYEYIIVLAF